MTATPDVRTIRPAPDRRMRHPVVGFPLLAAEGEEVTWNSYWERALQAGDIEVVQTASAAAPAPSAKPEPKKDA